MAMELTSTAFMEGASIPKKYTCDGKNVSPPLLWRGAPDGTLSFALIADDPDAPAGTWVHWVIYQIPPEKNGLQEEISARRKLENGMIQGENDFGRVGYGGPCPPGGTHRYFFKLYALDTGLDLQPGATKQELLNAMEGHILEETKLVGRYSRA